MRTFCDGGLFSVIVKVAVLFAPDSLTVSDVGVTVKPASLSLLMIGTFGGSGLSQGGDAVTLWNTAAPPTAADSPIDFESYPDADLFGGQSYDVVEGAFSGSLPGVLTSVVSNDVSQLAVGSPGYLIPEPASLGVFGLTAMVLLRRRDR